MLLSGRFYGEELFGAAINSAPMRLLFDHPRTGRFGHDEFRHAIEAAGLSVTGVKRAGFVGGWYVARKQG